ncbi:HOOK protein [Sarocladium implicatum]|nr:HOOK protein [Sarocladium implicatum]
MATYNHSAQVALFRAISIFSTPDEPSLGPIERTVEKVEELTDGLILGRILHQLDPDFDPATLQTKPDRSRYVSNKRNLQVVYKGLFRFVRRNVPELSCQAKKSDLNAISPNSDYTSATAQRIGSLVPSLFQLLAVMVVAAALGPDRGTFVPRMSDPSFSTDTQAEIMTIICQMEEDNKNSKDDELSEEDIDNFIGDRNIDLLVEEQNAALRQELDVARKTLSDYITRLEHLQMSHDDLKIEKERNDRELERLHNDLGEGEHKDLSMKALQRRVDEQMDVIATGEQQIRDYQQRIRQLEAEVAKWEQKGKEAEALRDQVAEWKHAAEEFEKRANTADRYKQKLESQQEMVRELQNVQYERAELQEQLRALTDDRADRTRQGESELQKMIDQSEQHLWDERAHKDQLIRELTILGEEVTRLNAQRTHDERFIQELQEQLQHGINDAPDRDSMDAGMGGNLADELTTAASGGEGGAMPSLELSRLRAENKFLRGAQEETAQLRQDLQEEKILRSRLQSEYNTQFQKLALVQDQADSLAAGSAAQDSEAFIKLRKEWQQQATDLEKIRKEKMSLEENFADVQRELTEAKAQVSASQKEGMDAITELRNTDQAISTSLRQELEPLRKEAKFLTSERANLQDQLVKAYISIENSRKDGGSEVNSSAGKDVTDIDKKINAKVEALRERLMERTQVGESLILEVFNLASATLEEVRKKEAQPQSPRQSQISDTASVVSAPREAESWPRTQEPLRPQSHAGHYYVSPFAHTADVPGRRHGIDETRPLFNGQPVQFEKSQQDLVETHRKLKAALGGETNAAQKAASDQVIKNLRRENALMATAWHDLTSRLQSNHVVLQRRPATPRSWLNKSRQMVNGQLRTRDSLYLY